MDAHDRKELPAYDEMNCKICGRSRLEHKEWHQCPKEESLVCSLCHKKCQYRCDHLTCRYRGEGEVRGFDSIDLRLQINNKKKFADKLYKQGKWRAADEICLEIAKLEKKLRDAV